MDINNAIEQLDWYFTVDGGAGAPITKEAYKTIREVVYMKKRNATWQYYLNDEGKARWKCSHCDKVCHKNPHDKLFCSNCGYVMRMEA